MAAPSHAPRKVAYYAGQVINLGQIRRKVLAMNSSNGRTIYQLDDKQWYDGDDIDRYNREWIDRIKTLQV